jgi:CHAT domain-containing protein/tetratricopeptide (TPR) repeat protein
MGLWRRYARTGSPEDLDAAVAVFQEAIALAPQSDPERANYLNSLGNALWDRYSRTGRVEDLEAAVAAYWQALDLTPEGAEGRPNHLTNLGKALRDRYNLTGSPEDLDRAISLCQEAVDVTPEGTLSRAIYLSNLGVALCDRYSLTSTPEDLSAAIAAYQQALDLTPEGAPTRANFLSSLGGALFSRYSLSDTPEDLDAAVVACQEAVDVTPEGTPSRANFLYNLGSALRHRYSLAGTPEDLRAAIVAWQAAREELHASMLSGLEIAQLAVRASLITRRLVQAYLDQDDAATALVALETGKALGLRMELARTHRMPINLTPAESAEYQNLTRQARLIPSQRRALSPVLHAEELTGLGRRYREALARLRELEARDPNFAVRAPDYPALRMVAARHGLVLVFLQPTDDRARGTLVFLVHPASPPLAPAEEDLLSLTGLTSEDLHRLLLRLPPGIEWKQEALPKILATGQGGEPLGWLAAYWLMHLTHRPPYDLQARALWEATLMRVLGELGTRLAGILAPRLRRLGVRRVVLFPSHPLGLLPLHAAPVSEGTDQALGDEFEISYAPSATALMRCLECSHRRGEQSAPSFAAVANPDGSLVFADDEVDSISRRFGGQVRVAHGPAATKEWLLGVAPEADFLELSTHASFDPDNPARSKMLLAHPGGHTAPRWLAAEATQRLPLADLQAECERLTLDDLWAGRLRLKEGCVVTASACETGQVDPHTRSEESPGFPAAFLGAGASGVVASLWAVNDLSTALLMEKTYEQMLPPHRFRPAEALQHAAGWLRNLSREEVLARLESLIQALRHQEQEGLWDALDATELAARHYRLALLMRCRIDVKVGPERAFAHPVYWAPFCAYGA